MSPAFNTSIAYLIGPDLVAKFVKLIIIFLPRQNRKCSEHSNDESSYENKYKLIKYQNKNIPEFFLELNFTLLQFNINK